MTLFQQRPIRPMLSTSGDPFDSEQYIFEPKWDGLRTILFLKDGKVELQNRNLRDVTLGFPEIQEVKEGIDAVEAIIDGEIVVLTHKGLPSFQQLQPRFGITDPHEAQTLAHNTPATLVAFDLLHLNRKDTINLPVQQRKQMLRKILHEGPFLLYSDHIASKGKQFYKLAKRKGFEGVVAKKIDSKYTPGLRSSEWIKMKSTETIDCIVVGYTAGEGERSTTFGALVLAVYDETGKLFHLGNVGGGFNHHELQTCKERLIMLERKTPVIEGEVESNSPIVWVKPSIVCEVEYGSMTDDRKLRFPRFKRLRTDIDPKTIRI
jgi:bifunctional non-homologous end joining protein LigD